MRNKETNLGDTLESYPSEDECGVSSSVRIDGTLAPMKWYSLPNVNMKQQFFTSHTDMLYVNMEESFPTSPAYLETDPNMSCTARYSPTSYPCTNSASITTNTSNQPISPGSGVTSNEVLTGNTLTGQHCQRQDGIVENQPYLQYHTLNTDRLAPLLQVLEGVSTSSSSSYFTPSTADTYEVSSSNSNDISSSTLNIVTSTNHDSTISCEGTEGDTHQFISQLSPISRVQTTIENLHTQPMDSTDLQFILTPNCEYHMTDGSKSDQVEFFIARETIGSSYSFTTENGYVIARPALSSCATIKLENIVSEVSSIPVDVSILDSLDETTQFDEETQNGIIKRETLSSCDLTFSQSDGLLLQSSNGSSKPSHLEEVESNQMVDLEEIAEYLESQPSTPCEEVPSNNMSNDKTRPNRKRHQQCDDTIMCIPDKTVPCRAQASLPATHLTLKIAGSTVKGVFARRRIPLKAKFGPLEGSKLQLSKTSSINNLQSQVHFLIRSDSEDYMFDVSDERTSNWMRYVRFEPGPYQNICLHQCDEELFFISCRTISPKQELILGYGTDYAELWGLPAPPTFAAESDETGAEWPCFECSLGFPTSAELQAHLNTHDEEIKDSHQNKRSRKKLFKIGNGNSHACDICNKTFSTIFSLKRHLQIHEQSKTKKNESQYYIMDEHIISTSSIIEEFNITSKDTSKSKEECVRLENFSNQMQGQKQNMFGQIQAFKRSSHYHREQEQLVPDSQMENDTLDSNCTDVNMEESFESPNKDGGSLNIDKTMDNSLQFKTLRNELESSQSRSVTSTNNHPKNRTGSIAPSQSSENIIAKSSLNNGKILNSVQNEESTKTLYIHCPMCPRTFKNGSHLKDHVQNQHVRPDGKYNCPLCAVVTDYKNIKKHIRIYHAVKKISCAECGNNFATNDKLRLHMLKHSDRRDFTCVECGKQFKRRDKLKDHTKKQHSGEGKCIKVKEVCSTSPSADPSAYLNFTFKCHPCKRGFKRRGMLVNHLAKQHPDIVRASVPELQLPIFRVARNYYCQHCDKVYKSSSKRKAHIIKNHPGESIPPSSRGKGLYDSQVEGKEGFSKCVGSIQSAPHVCPHQPCHKQYASKAKLLQHIRLNHSNQVSESKENNVSKMEKQTISTNQPDISEHRYISKSTSDEKVMKLNKASYQQYNNLNDKYATPKSISKSKVEESCSVNFAILTNTKVSNGYFNNEPLLQSVDSKYPSLETSNKPLAEIKLGEYLTGSSKINTAYKSVWKNNNDIPSIVNSVHSSAPLRIIQLLDGSQIIEESEIHSGELSKKSVYNKNVCDSIELGNISGQLMTENGNLPSVCVLSSNTVKPCYTDR